MAPPDSPAVFARVLGPAHVTVGGAAAPAELLWRKHVALLVYLARSPRKSRTREHLVGLLWSDREEKQARHSLSEALHVLRRVLGDGGVQADVDQVRLAADAVALDCDRFAELCALGEWAAAAALVAGEFLEGLSIPEANEFETWLAAERASWRSQALDALVHCADAEVARGDPAAGARAARPRPPLCGRGAELAALGAAWERARAGRGQVMLVEGEPGEGKTRLIEELVARAPPAALAGLAALDAQLDARFHPGAPAATAGDALGAAARAAAGERPLLLVLDDAQWTDAATLAALPALARDTTRHPVLLLLGVARGAPEAERLDALRARLGRDLEGSVVRLGRLDAAALRELAAWGLPAYGEDALDRLARRLERDTAGIPLLAVALVEALAAGYALAPEAPAWPSPQRTLVDSLPGDLPPAVVGVVCLRFRRLAPAAQLVLGAAAALGERVAAARLARATGLDGATVDQALDGLEWDRWLVADPRGYVFAAPIERAILLQEMITPGQVKRYRDNSPP